jgi:hypothetical protein
MTLPDIVAELRVIAHGLRRLPGRDAQEHASRILDLSNKLLKAPEARRSPPPPTRAEAERVFRQPSRRALFRDETAQL